MPLKVFLFTYMDEVGRDDHSAVWISAGLVRQTQGYLFYTLQTDNLGTYDTFVIKDGNPLATYREYRTTVLGQITQSDFATLITLARQVEMGPNPNDEFQISRLWMWAFVEALVRTTDLGRPALRACQIEIRDQAIEELRRQSRSREHDSAPGQGSSSYAARDASEFAAEVGADAAGID